ncbi:hypothetical protein [Vibrio rarus]|nr:hypothetical protein [Vibrio rarus]
MRSSHGWAIFYEMYLGFKHSISQTRLTPFLFTTPTVGDDFLIRSNEQ